MNNIKKIKDICLGLGLRPSRKNGQNFLLNDGLVEKIVISAELNRKESVLEIGPGLGVLTKEILKYPIKLIAVEQDQRLGKYLKDVFAQECEKEKLKIVGSDVMQLSNKDLGLLDDYKVVANLPYQITSPVLWRFLHYEKQKPVLMVLMMQKEVAERIEAKNTKKNLLYVLCNLYCQIEKVADVGKNNFWPTPEVESRVLKFKIKENLAVKDPQKLLRLAKAGFSKRRKMLKNNLADGLQDSAKEVQKKMVNVGLVEKSRAEDLSLQNWVDLCSQF